VKKVTVFSILEDDQDGRRGLAGRFELAEKTILLSPSDNVAVARVNLARSSEAVSSSGTFLLVDDIPAGHKMAIRSIGRGAEVLKYSQIIGTASRPIEPGSWVHTHNLTGEHDLSRAEMAVDRPQPPLLPEDLPRTFLGYRRADGRVGTRNFIAVLAASNCSSHVCAGIAEALRNFRSDSVDGVVALPHQEGCAHHEGPDTEQLERTMRGMVLHPNVAAVLMVGLGCEVNNISRYLGPGSRLAETNTVAGLEIQSSGGTLKSIAEGVHVVRGFVERIEGFKRTEASVGQIILGLNCGGSDAFSGISANPALGYASDLFVAAGATVVLAETPEIYGAEQVLTRRAVDVQTARKLIFIIQRFEEYFRRFGATMDSNPAPGNRRGGITNIVEKSLGAVMKGGTTMLQGVVDFAEQVTAKGLVVMDTPGYDPVSITGIAAGGCNVIAFTTGRGSAIGFPVVPVLKIASNSRTFHGMRDNMDMNAGEIVDGTASVREIGIEIYRHLIRVASGECTKSETLGVKEFVPWRIGPVV
jgi:altronate hydrolase